MITFLPSCQKSEDLLSQLGVVSCNFWVDVPLVLKRKESPVMYIERITREKITKFIEENPESYSILSCYKAIFIGRRLVTKPQNIDDFHKLIKLLSGRNHAVHSCVIFQHNGKTVIRRTITRVKMKVISKEEVTLLCHNFEESFENFWNYTPKFSRFCIKIVGSYTSLLGLPCYETANILEGVVAKESLT